MDMRQLQDVLDTLRDEKFDREQEISNIIDKVRGNEATYNRTNTTPEGVTMKRLELCSHLINHVKKEEPKDYPLPGTSDLHAQVVRETKNEVVETRKLRRQMQHRLQNITNDIQYLQDKKSGIDNMQRACMEATKKVAQRSYREEYREIKRLFQDVKNDLHMVVETLFPGNRVLKRLLAKLTLAYDRGGDNAYVNVTPDILEYVHFFLEADIITYHRNDKSKIRLADML